MAGFTNDANLKEIVFCDNVDFSGGAAPAAQVSANGQLLIGAASDPRIRVNTLSAGNGITITNGPGTITIAASGEGFLWQNIAVNTLGVAETGYRATAALTFTLPSGALNGTAINIICRTAGAVVVTAGAADKIRVGNQITSAVGGTATNTGIGQNLSLIYDTSANVWEALSYVGNWTLS